MTAAGPTAPLADRPTAAPASAHRPEVQALRALAALGVVVYHFWPGRLAGGYVGVDVFFVISGFLITGHLLRETDATGTVDLPRFWARRARRLLPASYLVVAVSLLGVFLLLPRLLWSQNLHEVVASSLYVENWWLAHDAVDYLASANDPSVVQHYWTLSVEEQFYLGWPLLLLLVRPRTRGCGRRGVGLAVGVVTVLSLVASVWLTATSPSWAYFVTPGRMWEFGVGALLALLLSRQRRRRHATTGSGARLAAGASWAGLLVLVGVMLGYSDATPFPGAAALPPTLATALVIAAGMPACRLAPSRLLALRPVQWLGDVSYSLYLWHWPLLILAPAALGRELGLLSRLTLLAATVVLAWLTTRYVEDPIRRHRRVLHASPRATLLAAAALALAMVVPGIGGLRAVDADAAHARAAVEALVASQPRCFGAASMDAQTPCHNPRLDHTLVPTPETVRTGLIDYPGCFADYADTSLLDCSFGTPSSGTPRVLLVGDSHAQMFLPTLVDLARDGRLSVDAQLKAACPWAAPPPERQPKQYGRECGLWRGALQEWLRDHARDYDLVLTSGRMDDLPGDTGQEQHDLAAAWDVVARQGVPVAAILDNPRWRRDPNQCLSALGTDRVTPAACGLPRSEMPHHVDPQRGAARLIDNAYVVDLGDLYCRDDWCPAVAGGVNMYRDYSHLSVPYAATLGPYLYRRLVAQGLLAAPR